MITVHCCSVFVLIWSLTESVHSAASPQKKKKGWWSETGGPDNEEGDVYFLGAATCICIKLHSARDPDPAPLQFPDPRQPPVLSLTFSRLLPLLSAGNLTSTSAHAQVVHEVVTEEDRILDLVNYDLVTFPAALPTGDWLTALTARARSFRGSCKLGPVTCQ